MDTGPDFRLWPPVAIFAPLVAGVALTEVVGEPAALESVWARPIGWILLGLFAAWNGWSLVLMRQHRTGLLPGQETRLILDEGPFAVSRNPLYVGLLAAYLGLALLWPSLWALALLPVAFAGLWWGAIGPEERYLRSKFGRDYVAYSGRVRRWL